MKFVCIKPFMTPNGVKYSKGETINIHDYEMMSMQDKSNFIEESEDDYYNRLAKIEALKDIHMYI